MTVPRRKADVAMVGALLAMLVQFGGLIWQAAKLSSAVDQIQTVTARLEAADLRREATQQSAMERLRVLEVQQATTERRVDRLEKYHESGGR